MGRSTIFLTGCATGALLALGIADGATMALALAGIAAVLAGVSRALEWLRCRIEDEFDD